MQANSDTLLVLMVIINALLLIATVFLARAAFSQAKAAQAMRKMQELQLVLDQGNKIIENMKEETDRFISAVNISTSAKEIATFRDGIHEEFEREFMKMVELMATFGVVKKVNKRNSISETGHRLRIFVKWLYTGDIPSNTHSCLHSLLKCICNGK